MLNKIWRALKEVFWNWIVALFVIADVIGLLQKRWINIDLEFGKLFFIGFIVSTIHTVYKKNSVIDQFHSKQESILKPDVIITKQHWGYDLVQIQNIGAEQIIGFQVFRKWVSNSGEIQNQEVLNEFLEEHDDPIRSRGKSCTELEPGKKVRFLLPPSLDYRIEVTVKGVGMKTKQLVDKTEIIGNR